MTTMFSLYSEMKVALKYLDLSFFDMDKVTLIPKDDGIVRLEYEGRAIEIDLNRLEM